MKALFRHRSVRWWIAIRRHAPALVAGLVLVALAIYAGRRYWYLPQVADVNEAIRMLPAEIDAAKREGLPFSASQLRPDPPIEDFENAESIIRRMVTAERTLSSGHSRDKEFARKFLGNSWSVKPEEIDPLIEKQSEVLSLARAAANKPHCDFHYNFSNPVATNMPELPHVRNAITFLTARAIRHAQKGNLGDCLSDLQTAIKFSRFMSDIPNQLGESFCVSFLVNVQNALIQVVATAPLNSIDRNRIRGFLPSTILRPDFRKLLSEEFWNGWYCSHHMEYLGRFQLSGPWQDRYLLFPQAGQSRLIQYFRSAMRLTMKKHTSTLDMLKEIHALNVDTVEQEGASYDLVPLLMPKLESLLIAQLKNEARIGILESLIDMMDKGGDPRDFVPPIDPFSHRPLYTTQIGDHLTLTTSTPPPKREGLWIWSDEPLSISYYANSQNRRARIRIQ